MNAEQEIEVGMWPEPATSGQHVGMPKGVKVTHKPTGIIVICDTERSQHANRQKALDFIARAVLEAALATKPAKGGEGG
jgi:protein subunit release factor A